MSIKKQKKAKRKYYWFVYIDTSENPLVYHDTTSDGGHPFWYMKDMNEARKNDSLVLLNWKEITKKEFLEHTENCH